MALGLPSLSTAGAEGRRDGSTEGRKDRQIVAAAREEETETPRADWIDLFQRF